MHVWRLSRSIDLIGVHGVSHLERGQEVYDPYLVSALRRARVFLFPVA